MVITIERDAAFVNRFKSITIESTSPEITQEIDTQQLLASGTAVMIEPDAMTKQKESLNSIPLCL